MVLRRKATTVATVALVVIVAAMATAAEDPQRWLPFLKNNKLPESSMPLSYSLTPKNYFDLVPDNLRDRKATEPMSDPACDGDMVSVEQQDAYTYQTENYLTAVGTNIYDAAVWCMSTALLGAPELCTKYMNDVLVAHKTVQFQNIRATAPCKGVMYFDQCTDNCGFCYGDGAVSLGDDNAYFFRMIADYWALEGTVDARCPAKGKTWTWNDYKPVLGENSWAQLIGPAQHAMISAKWDAKAVPDDHPLFKLAIPFLTTLEAMRVGDTGAVYYTAWNTWFGHTKDSMRAGATFSIENMASLYAGLEALEYILKNKPNSAHAGQLPRVTALLDGSRRALIASWDPEKKFFRQGGTYNKNTKALEWTQNGATDFAVDCQTWVATVLGVDLVDATFGAGASYELWQNTKRLGGYHCKDTGAFCGVGYTYTDLDGEILSGEWTYGAINWLKAMLVQAEGKYSTEQLNNLRMDIAAMEGATARLLYSQADINGNKYDAIKYADRRYYIPFGWWANPLPSVASVGWAAMTQAGYNPFSVKHGSYYPYADSRVTAPPGFDTTSASWTSSPDSTTTAAPNGGSGTDAPPATGDGSGSSGGGGATPAPSNGGGATPSPNGGSGSDQPTAPPQTSAPTKDPTTPQTTWPGGDDSSAAGVALAAAVAVSVAVALLN